MILNHIDGHIFRLFLYQADQYGKSGPLTANGYLRYIQFFGGKTHPRKLNAKHIEKFLSHLATKGNFAASTQRQALNALVFLYRDVLDQPLDGKIAPVR